MATDLEPRSASTKLDSFVDKQIHQVQDRIRRLDVSRSLLYLGVTVLGYGLLMALLDITLQASRPGLVDTLHLASFVAFLGVAGYFLVQTFRGMSHRINPRYAAKQLEETVPEAKNSVINWLDLKEERLPGAIRGAISQKAAKDLKKTGTDKAVNPRGNWLLFSILGVLVIGFLVLLATRPNQFGSLLQRAYAPFKDFQLGTQTRITMINPPKGNLIVPPDRRVEIRARIGGTYPGMNKPGAPSILFRYQQSDPFVPIPLEEDTDGTWFTIRKPDQVRTGFFYKVAAGDTETEEYQVVARTDPRPVRFDVTYKYRPYLRLKDEAVSFPNEKSLEPRIQARRGTEVTMIVHTNRKLQAGHVTLETGGERHQFDGKVMPEETSFEVQWLLEKSGTMRIFFTSKDDEPNSSAELYTVIAEEDKAPQVVLTEPGKEITLPANGTLQLTGYAVDEFGIRSMALQMKVAEGAKADLKGKAFREGKDFRFGDGSYPDKMEYKEFVALNEVKSPDDKLFSLSAGMVLEYWLEARDNSDYPRKEGNLGVSKSYRVRISPPTKDEKKEKEERSKAEQGQKDFEKKQDEKHNKENKDRSEAAKGGGEPKTGGSKDSEADELKKKGEELAKKLEQERNEKSPGESKGDESASSDTKSGESSKEGAAPKSKDAKGEPKDKSGAKGSEGKTSAAEPKDKGEKEKGDPSAGKSREEGKSPPDASAKGAETKSGGEEKSTSKAGETGGMKDKAAETKDGGTKTSDSTPPATARETPPDTKMDETASKTGDTAKEGGAGASAKSDPKSTGGNGPPTETKTPPTKGPDTAAKAKSETPGKIDPSSVKAGDHKKTDAASAPKGPEGGAGEKSMTKPGGTGKKETEPPASAKAGKEGPKKSGGASTKEGKAKDKSDPATARGDGKTADKKDSREITKEDLDKFREMLKDPKKAEEVANELSRLAKEGKDEKLKNAAEKILNEDGRDASTPGKTKAPGEKNMDEEATGTAKEAGSVDPKKKTPPAEPRDGKHEAGDSSAKGEPVKKDLDPKKDIDPTRDAHAATKTGERHKAAEGFDDEDRKAIEAVQDFLKRGGDLQLEDLARYLKKVDSDSLKGTGWTKDELDSWLKAASAHDERIARQKKTPSKASDTAKGGVGSLPGFGPTGIGSSGATPSDPLIGGRPLPPPEFREPYRIFTGGGKK